MTNRLPVPPELMHLIEKRNHEERRKTDRRSGKDRREEEAGPVEAIDSIEDPAPNLPNDSPCLDT